MDSTAKPDAHHRDRRRRCLLISAAVLGLGLLILILALTVFRVRNATTTVNSIHLAGFHAGFNPLDLAVDLNVTLDLDITATNPNRASFKYGFGSAEVYYRRILAGEATIPPGEVSAGGSERTEVVLTMFAGRLLGESGNLYADYVAGSVSFTTSTRIPGRVTVLGIFKFHMVLYSTCDVVINVANQTVQNTDCSYRTKL